MPLDIANAKILVIDDEEDICDLIKDILEDEGFTVDVAFNGTSAQEKIKSFQPNLVLLDIWMPDIDGISLLNEWHRAYTRLPFSVIMMSGHGTLEHAIEATKLGAFDFLEKPLTLAKLIAVVKRALKECENARQTKPKSDYSAPTFVEPVGKSRIFTHLKEQALQIAQAGNRTVLISGEVGVGKHLFANYIHSLSDRRDAPIISVNMGQLSVENIDAVFLGTENGNVITEGLIEQADGGTIVLQQISHLDLGAQEKLAAIINTHDYLRINGKTPLTQNVRFIALTQDDLPLLVSEKEFLEDLYFKINTLPLTIPPLRNHPEDVPDLLGYFVHFFVDEEKLNYRHFSIAAQNRLRNHNWLGNVQELKGIVQQLLILGKDEEITLDEINSILEKKSEPSQGTQIEHLPLDLPLREAREQFERAYLIAQFKACDGNIAKLADKVGMERTNLYRKLKSLDIDPKRIG